VAEAPTLIELSPFDRESAGSFVSFLNATLAGAGRRGWRAEAVLSESARKAPWVEDVQRVAAKVEFAPMEGRREMTTWLREYLARRKGPLVVHTHFTSWDIPAALLASARNGRHVWWHIHTIYRRDPLTFARNVLRFVPLGRRLDGVLCPSEGAAAMLHSRGIPKSRLHVLPGSIDLSRFPTLDRETRLEAREALGLAADDEVLLHFGWDWPYKGGDLFLAAAAELVRSGRSRVIAMTQTEDERALATARRLGIEGSVRLLGHHDDVGTLFGAADVFVKASEREGVPYAVLESLASGTAVVATNIPGHPLAQGAVTACAVAPPTPTALAGSIAKMLDRPSGDRIEQAEEARRWIADNLTTDVLADRMLDMFAAGI
jgi:glycosyltransferase involved in cell wall biosynthesis